jgi:hypothetical protein
MIKVNAAAMINRIQLFQAQRNKDTSRTKRYLSSLGQKKSPFVTKIHTQMLSLNHKIISLDDLNKNLEDYPEAVSHEGKLKRRGKEAVLNQSVKSLQLYFNGLLQFTFILTDEGIRKFTI